MIKGEHTYVVCTLYTCVTYILCIGQILYPLPTLMCEGIKRQGLIGLKVGSPAKFLQYKVHIKHPLYNIPACIPCIQKRWE